MQHVHRYVAPLLVDVVVSYSASCVLHEFRSRRVRLDCYGGDGDLQLRMKSLQLGARARRSDH